MAAEFPCHRNDCCERSCCKHSISIRSERMLVEQFQYNILFRWFVGLSMDDEVWHATTFTKNRQRLIDGDIAQRFFER